MCVCVRTLVFTKKNYYLIYVRQRRWVGWFILCQTYDGT